MQLLLIAFALCAMLGGALGGIVKSERSLAGCDARPFILLQPAITHSPIVDLQWIEKNDLSVFGITGKVGLDSGGLWLSKDGGKSWSEKTAELTNSISAAEATDVIAVLVQKSNPANVVLIGAGTYMTSTDYGKTLTPKQNVNLFKGSAIKSIRRHPHHDNWMLMLVKRPLCKVVAHSMQECPYDLMLSQIEDCAIYATLYVNPAHQPCTSTLYINPYTSTLYIDPIEDSAIYATLYVNPEDYDQIEDSAIYATLYVNPEDYDQAWDPDVHFVKSSNFFKDYNIMVHCGNMFELIAGGIYLAFANSCKYGVGGGKNTEGAINPDGITLYTSMDAGNDFIKACLPVALKQEGYELLETHDGTGAIEGYELLETHHGMDAIVIAEFSISTMLIDIPTSSVYTAGPHQALFSVSMNDLNHGPFGVSMDLSRVEGLPGVYIANDMVSRPASGDDFSDLSRGEGLPGVHIANDMVSRPASSYDYSDAYDYYGYSEFLGKPMVMTQITYSGGGKWQRIKAPSTFNSPKCNSGGGKWQRIKAPSTFNSPKCNSAMPGVYTNPSAPGLIMGVGNVGTNGVGLEDNDGLCTWLSSDGGVTWTDVAPMPMIYEFADWGSTIVMGKPAEEVWFSTDNGGCWQKVPLTTALLVDNIRIEPDGQRPRVIVHGKACRQPASMKCSYMEDDVSSKQEGLMYMVDISDLMSGMIGLCGAQSYEMWGIPVSATDSSARCMLGELAAGGVYMVDISDLVQRRRANANCLNGPDFLRPLATNKTCQCTYEADLECDYGWLKTGTGVDGKTQCLKLPDEVLPTCPELNKGEYTVSESGIRRVHADVCVDGDLHMINDTDGKGKVKPDWKHEHPGGGSSSSKKRGFMFHFFIFILVTAVLAAAFVGWGRSETYNNMDQDLGYFQPLGEVPEHEAGVFTIK
eukprot:gene15566-21663_t